MMQRMNNFQKRFVYLWLIGGLVVCLLGGLGLVVEASTPLSVAGYLDFSYNPTNDPAIVNDPTGEKPESKLWWNDGFWWGSLYNPTAGEYRIYRLNWGTQTWEDTGVALDTRDDTKADVLWDQANHKLYVVSHVYTDIGSRVNQAVNYGKLFRYTYDPNGQTYTLDAGFPTNVNKDKSETLVIAQERSNAQRLWVTYVSRDPPATNGQVYVNRSTDGGATWGISGTDPIVLPFAEATTGESDIASIIAFTDNGGNKIGVVWSNALTNGLYFATLADGQNLNTGWTLATIPLPIGADDHISLKALHTTSTGHVFAAIKTLAPITEPTAPEIGMVVRNPNGAFSFHQYSTKANNDTRPISVIDEGADPNSTADDQAYIFVTGKPGGSKICYKSLAVNTLTGNPNATFPAGDCGTVFLEDPAYNYLDNATSSKQNVNATTGLVILASNSLTGTPRVYVHNVLGDPPPVVTAVSPSRNITDVLFNTAIQVSFSKPMNLATFNNTTFSVDDGTGVRTGSFTIDASGLVVTFQPDAPLKASTVYTVRLTTGILDTTGQALFQRAAFAGDPLIREQWSFTTAAPSVQFSAASYSVAENGGTATITATLNMTSSLAVTVAYATSDGTAVAGTDYTATSGMLTFNPGQISQAFAVPVLDDASSQGNLIANLTLSSPSNASLGAPPTATLIIVDDEGPPTVQFAPTAYTVAENEGKATITVNLSHADVGTIAVDYTISDGTATSGLDYTGANGTLTFAPGETSKSFDIQILNEAVFEADETVNLNLSNPVPATVPLPVPGNTAVLTILNDDAEPVVAFSSATYSAGEEIGTATITAQLDHASAFLVTVDVATSDGTARTPADYMALNTILTFAPGETSKAFSVTLSDDALDEPDELINLALSNAAGATLGTQANTLLTIVDNDTPPVVQFSDAVYSVRENAGTATITLILSAASGKVVTVEYATSDGTATAGSDYTATSNIVSFDPGQTSQTFTVEVIDDVPDEPDETVNLALSNASNAVLGTPAAATLTIEDRDSAPTVQFTSATYTVNEDEGAATVTVSLGVPSGKTVTVAYATSNDTATAGSDYTATSGTLTFNPGQTSQTFTIPVSEDALDEPDETVNLALSNPANATLGTPSIATLTVVDNDGVPTVQFSTVTYSVNEGEATATITVQLSNVAAQPVTVAYATSNGTATAGSDYTAASGTLTFNPGELSQSFSVAVAEDALDEPDETVNLALSSPANATLGTRASATLILIDNDGVPTVRFSAATYSVNEESGIATITVQLSNVAAQAVAVEYDTSNGTAVAGSDYTAASGTLTFNPGELSQTFTVAVADDALDEPDETVNLALSNPADAILGTQANASLTIVDNDNAPTVQFSAATYTVNENGGTATITVNLSNGAGQTVTVAYATSNGTATAGTDYTAASGTLTFNPGQTSQSFTVAVAEDALDEPDETVNLTLSNPTTVALGTLANATLTIIDDINSSPTPTLYLPLIYK